MFGIGIASGNRGRQRRKSQNQVHADSVGLFGIVWGRLDCAVVDIIGVSRARGACMHRIAENRVGRPISISFCVSACKTKAKRENQESKNTTQYQYQVASLTLSFPSCLLSSSRHRLLCPTHTRSSAIVHYCCCFMLHYTHTGRQAPNRRSRAAPIRSTHRNTGPVGCYSLDRQPPPLPPPSAAAVCRPSLERLDDVGLGLAGRLVGAVALDGLG